MKPNLLHIDRPAQKAHTRHRRSGHWLSTIADWGARSIAAITALSLLSAPLDVRASDFPTARVNTTGLAVTDDSGNTSMLDQITVIIADRESEFVDFMIADVERRRQAEEEFFAAIAGEEP